MLTSGGSESVNAAIQGACLARSGSTSSPRIVTSNIEHVVVSATAEYLATYRGCKVDVVPVNADGIVAASDVIAAVTPDTAIISIMLANNEIGSLQPVKQICDGLLKAGLRGSVLVHTDASQAAGKIRVDVQDLGVDLLTVAGHKLYGPKGVGALYVREGLFESGRIHKFMHGANHESNRRAGTENVLLATGFGVACEVARRHLEDGEVEAMEKLRSRLKESIVDKCAVRDGFVRVNGPAGAAQRLPNTLSISFRGLFAGDMMAAFGGRLACSAGAACKSSDSRAKISHVLCAAGLDAEYARGTLRLSVGRFTSLDDVDDAARIVAEAALALSAENDEADAPKPTSLVYLEDTYMFEHATKVVRVIPSNDDPAAAVVITASTAMHPQGGGQPTDKGQMTSSSGVVFDVSMVRMAEGGLVHHTGTFRDGSGIFTPDESVVQRVDEDARRLFARIHSAGHLIDQAMILSGVSLKAGKGYHFAKGAYVEYVGSVPAEERPALKASLQKHLDTLTVEKDVPTLVDRLAPSDAAARCVDGEDTDFSRVDADGLVRIVCVGSEKGCPCGGTHVKSTSEIGRIVVRKLKNSKGNLRVSYNVEA